MESSRYMTQRKLLLLLKFTLRAVERRGVKQEKRFKIYVCDIYDIPK